MTKMGVCGEGGDRPPRAMGTEASRWNAHSVSCLKINKGSQMLGTCLKKKEQ